MVYLFSCREILIIIIAKAIKISRMRVRARALCVFIITYFCCTATTLVV